MTRRFTIPTNLNQLRDLGAQLKLSQKVMVIVALPLLCQLFIFAGIWLVVNQAERHANAAENASMLVTRTNSITNEIYAAGGSLAAFIATKNKKFEARFNDFLAAAQTDLDSMDSLARSSERQQQIYANEKQHVNAMLTFLRSMRDKTTDASSHRHLLVMHNQHKLAQSAAQNYLENMQQVMSEFEAEATLQKAQLAKAKTLVGQTIAGGMLLSILLGLFVSLTFATHIINQVERLRMKAHKLVANDDLGQESNGNDEIADLDRTLHEVAGILSRNIEKEKQLDEAKRSLIAMVSHDLRAPLTSAQAFFGLLSSGKYGPLNGQGKLTLRAVDSSVGHVCNLVEDLLTLASEGWHEAVTERFDVDLGAVLNDAVQIVKPAAELKSIRLVADSFPDATVSASETRLVQAFVNILSNSIKYCCEGSTVTITSTVTETGCHIGISDNGPGFSCENPFERNARGQHKNIPGRGLGLFLCKAIIEEHEGTITLNHGADKGSRFDIFLPIITAAHRTEPAKSSDGLEAIAS